MDSSFSNELREPKRLKTLAFHIQSSEFSNLLHKFVLDNSYPNESSNEGYIGACLRAMSDCIADPHNEEGHRVLYLAVLKNSHIMVKRILSCLKNIDVNKRWQHGDTSLHIAARMGHFSVVQELLSANADINIKNRGGYTALCDITDLDVIKLLVNNGADVNLGGSCGGPLHLAAASGNLDAVKYLIYSGADVNQKSPNNSATPLKLAVRKGDLEVVEFLVNNGAERSTVDDAIFSATIFGNLEVLKYLLRCGADMNAKDNCGNSILHLAAESGDLATVEFLVRIGADMNAKDRFQETPLHVALRSYQLKVARFLLAKGANVNARDREGRTLLVWSVYWDCTVTLTLLVDHGVNLNAVNEHGGTILHLAAEYGSLRVAKFLIDKGCDVRAVDRWGRSPLYIAGMARHFALCKLLLVNGATCAFKT